MVRQARRGRPDPPPERSRWTRRTLAVEKGASAADRWAKKQLDRRGGARRRPGYRSDPNAAYRGRLRRKFALLCRAPSNRVASCTPTLGLATSPWDREITATGPPRSKRLCSLRPVCCHGSISRDFAAEAIATGHSSGGRPFRSSRLLSDESTFRFNRRRSRTAGQTLFSVGPKRRLPGRRHTPQ